MLADNVNWFVLLALFPVHDRFRLGLGGFSSPSRQQKCLHLHLVSTCPNRKKSCLRCFVLALVVTRPSSVFEPGWLFDLAGLLTGSFLYVAFFHACCVWYFLDRAGNFIVAARPIGSLICLNEPCSYCLDQTTYLRPRGRRIPGHPHRRCQSGNSPWLCRGKDRCFSDVRYSSWAVPSIQGSFPSFLSNEAEMKELEVEASTPRTS